MLLTISNDTGYNATILRAQVNCNTDALPLMPRVVFYGMVSDETSAMAALAATCVFHKYCGEQIDFEGTELSPNYLTAIRRIVGSDVNVSTVNGRSNNLTEQGIDMMVHHSSVPAPQSPSDTRRAARHITWDGDFVDTNIRSSSGSRLSEVYTNARLVADDLHISAAIGLLAGAGRLRNLYLSDNAPETDMTKLRRALAEAGMNVVFS